MHWILDFRAFNTDSAPDPRLDTELDLRYGLTGWKTENLGRKLPFWCKIVDGDFNFCA
jgi:hypothetical protein